MVRIAVINYGVGNLHSIKKGIELAGAEVKVTCNSLEIATSDGIVLPGVGAFRSAMKNLRPIVRVLEKCVSERKPLLGICLGIELLMEESEENGGEEGLGWIKGKVVRLPKAVKIPHMGWNSLKILRPHFLLKGVKTGDEVYFVHSYFLRLEKKEAVLATCEYGVEFPAVVASGPLMGMQFHPEKSGRVGLKILRNFVELVEAGA